MVIVSISLSSQTDAAKEGNLQNVLGYQGTKSCLNWGGITNHELLTPLIITRFHYAKKFENHGLID